MHLFYYIDMIYTFHHMKILIYMQTIYTLMWHKDN